MSDMADVLREHGIYGFNGSEISCECRARGPWFTQREYSTHLAAALTAAGFGPVQAARAEALEDAADDAWKRGYDACREGQQRHSPYRARAVAERGEPSGP